VLLLLFTLGQSYVMSGIIGYFVQSGKGSVVLTAVLMTAALVGSLTAIAWTNCVDLTGMSGVMTAVGLGVMATAVLGLLFGGGGLLSGVLVLLFGVMLVYDTQMVLGKGDVALGYDDYVIGALVIYIDIVTIFIELLKIFGRSDE
jgi:protein lifeguard